jgi:hypothetical protein
MVTHVFSIVPLPTEEAGRGARTLPAWVGFSLVTAVVGVVGGVVGSTAMVADHGGGGARAVSNYMTEPVASVTLGQGGAVVKFPRPAICPEEGRRGTADQFETGAIWVVERPDDTAAVTAVSGVSGGATEPSRQCEGFTASTDRIFS